LISAPLFDRWPAIGLRSLSRERRGVGSSPALPFRCEEGETRTEGFRRARPLASHPGLVSTAAVRRPALPRLLAQGSRYARYSERHADPRLL